MYLDEEELCCFTEFISRKIMHLGLAFLGSGMASIKEIPCFISLNSEDLTKKE
ncbi:hypothetical protein ACS0TY_000310 [Phlomoides rotata]